MRQIRVVYLSMLVPAGMIVGTVQGVTYATNRDVIVLRDVYAYDHEGD